jgi:proline dehydrogenase
LLIVTLAQILPKSFIRVFASRYIAGEYLSDCVRVVRELNSKKILATIDVLGEDTTKIEEANNATNEAIDVLKKIADEKLDSTLSVKLTQLGLKLSYDICLENMERILYTAKELNNYVEIDMEDSTCTYDTVNMFKELRKNYSNCGMVMQAYLREAENIFNGTLKDLNGSSVRLCKGIYNESEEIAYKDKKGIRDNFVYLLDYLFQNNIYVGIATHDIYLVNAAKQLIKKYNKSFDEFEFQMLLGVKIDLRDQLVKEGYKVRIYVPFGTQWYKYSFRRMRENPDLAKNIALNIFSKRS